MVISNQESDEDSGIGDYQETMDYQCDICLKSGFRSQKSLDMHKLRSHRVSPRGSGKKRASTHVGGLETPSTDFDPRDSEIENLRKELKQMQLERQRLQEEAKIRKIAPDYFKTPSGDSEEDRLLLAIQRRRLLAAETMRVQAEAEAIRSPPPRNNPGSEEIKELKSEIKSLTQRLEDQRYSILLDHTKSLEKKIEGLTTSTDRYTTTLGAVERTIKPISEYILIPKQAPKEKLVEVDAKTGLYERLERESGGKYIIEE